MRAVSKMKRKNILAQSQRIVSDMTTTDSSSASSLVDTISGMHRQLLEQAKLLMKHSILIKQTQTTRVTQKQIGIKCYIGLGC